MGEGLVITCNFFLVDSSLLIQRPHFPWLPDPLAWRIGALVFRALPSLQARLLLPRLCSHLPSSQTRAHDPCCPVLLHASGLLHGLPSA